MRYLKLFETEADFENGKSQLEKPWVALTKDDEVVHYYENEPTPPEPPFTGNYIHYTSTDGNIVVPNVSDAAHWGANLTANTYDNGVGTWWFDGIPTKMNYNIDTDLGMFENCNNLLSLEIPNSVTSIEAYAFASCSGLTAIEFPNSVTEIAFRLFYRSKGITSIVIPNSVTSIADRAFFWCSNLSDFNYGGTMAEWNNVTLGIDWIYGVSFTVVHCSDGDSTRLS